MRSESEITIQIKKSDRRSGRAMEIRKSNSDWEVRRRQGRSTEGSAAEIGKSNINRKCGRDRKEYHKPEVWQQIGK